MDTVKDSAPKPKRKVLVVEDNLVNLMILENILKSDYEVLKAENGRVAMEILHGTSGNAISAVVLDLIMPVMDGYEVLRQVRADKRLSQLPIIVASSPDSGCDSPKEIEALSLGANDYIAKPYNAQIIRHRLANTIWLRETAAFVNTVQHDPLTGLYSREYFYLEVGNTLKAQPGQKFDMLCCNIDRFQLVNDLYGTATGDRLLKRCAEVLQNSYQNILLCSRLGADTFAFLVEHQPAEYYRNLYFERAIAEINSASDKMSISLRWGIYVVNNSAPESADIICDRATLAMNSIKGLYDKYYRYYDDTLRQQLLDEQFIVENMKKALQEGQFEVYFQPKYELKTEKIVGAEALVRWNSPIKGFMLPGQFIPLFEKNGFITDLDFYVWETCCRKIRAWLDAGHRALPISVNVSRADIYKPGLDQLLLRLIQKYDLSPQNLYLEITESAYTENSHQMAQTVNSLKRLGFSIEMDDFGSGYSSLNMLSELPIDILKLDIGFLQRHEQKSGRAILSFIISLAKWMNLGIIAEGAETAEQVNLLRSLGCDCVQGYYYSRPLPAEEFLKMLLIPGKVFEIVEGESTEAGAKNRTSAYRPQAIIFYSSDQENAALLQKLFSKRYAVLNFGRPGEQVRRVAAEKAVIIYDVTKPGFEAELGGILQQCDPVNVPVVALINTPEEMQVAYDLGVKDCIEKPLRETPTQKRIENVIAGTQTSPIAREQEINMALLEMKKRAEHDSLTGLLNRAEFESRVSEFFQKGSDPRGVFIITDIDNFKGINDTFGHAAGDSALQSVAHTLLSLFPETGLVGRIGDDEFAIFIPYLMEYPQLEGKLRRLCSFSVTALNDQTIHCTAGYCFSPVDGEDFQSMYEHADAALLCAKRSGKAQFVRYSSEMESDYNSMLENRAVTMLDNVSDATFVCDAETNQIIFINDTACRLLHREKKNCLGAYCYELFWNRCDHCDRCPAIGQCHDHYYEEDALMSDGRTPIHIKAKMDCWQGRNVKIHYLQSGQSVT